MRGASIRARAACFFGVASLLAGIALAQQPENYPDKPITLVIPFAPGAGTDAMGRLLAGKLADELKVPVNPENKTGAGGAIGARFVAQSAPDGTNLLLVVSPFTTTAASMSNPGYDPVADFAPVALIATGPLVWVANLGVKASNMRELIALARSNPGRLNYASAGVGSVNHLVLELLKSRARISIVHIPYRGTALAIPDLVSGKLDLLFDSLPSGLPHVKDGRLRALGVTSAKRSPLLPDLPAVAESVPGYETVTWFGLYGPRGLPADIVQRINTAVNQALQDSDVKERLARLGIEPAGGTPQQFAVMTDTDRARWKKIIADRRLTAD